MNLVERKSESTPDLPVVAEQSAMNKVTDIHKDRSMKHGFVRFGPLIIEGHYPYADADIHNNRNLTDQSIDRLKGILLYGLVAGKLAKRAGISISRNWADPANENGVSLSLNSVENVFNLAIMAATHGRRAQQKIPIEDIYTLLIKSDIASVSKGFEDIRKHRVAPRFFKGIVFLEEIPHPSSLMRDFIDCESSTVQQRVNKTLQTILSVYKDPNLAIPVYGLSGSLYWPKEISYQEVQNIVKERINSET